MASRSYKPLICPKKQHGTLVTSIQIYHLKQRQTSKFNLCLHTFSTSIYDVGRDTFLPSEGQEAEY